MLEMDDIFFLEFSQNFAIFCKLQDGYIIKQHINQYTSAYKYLRFFEEFLRNKHDKFLVFNYEEGKILNNVAKQKYFD